MGAWGASETIGGRILLTQNVVIWVQSATILVQNAAICTLPGSYRNLVGCRYDEGLPIQSAPKYKGGCRQTRRPPQVSRHCGSSLPPEWFESRSVPSSVWTG